MDVAQEAYVDQVFQRRRLDSEQLKSFLDYCFAKELFSIPEYARILRIATEEKNFKRFWEEIRKVICDSPHGFCLFNTFITKKCPNLPKCEELKFSNVQREVKEKAFKIGGVPEKPEYFVQRTNQYDDLLRLLEDDQFNAICLNGAIGMGKTTLVRCVVDDVQLLSTKFNYKIYWIDLYRKVEEDCLKIMFDFYNKILIHDDNINLPQLSKYPASIGIMRNHLLKIFLEVKSYKKALIILDNVQSQEIVAHFKDLSHLLVISDEQIGFENMEHISIKQGFTQEESIEILSKAVKNPSEEFKLNLYKIHNLCKGDPATITVWAKFLRHNKHEFQDNPNKWIEKKFEGVIKEANKKRLEIIEVWFKELDDTKKRRIEKLVIFPRDNQSLTTKVLETYLNMNSSEVEDLLEELKQKNFITSTYSEITQTSYYEFVHFFLDSIKAIALMKNDNKTVVSYHQEFIDNYYLKLTHYGKFRNDVYIFKYLAYHLKEAGSSYASYFKIFLNLEFIDFKIKATCYTDALIDFKMYENEIVNNDDKNRRHLKDLKSLVEEAGPKLTASSNIVHYALNLSDNSPVYKDARRIVLQNDSTLYLKSSEYQKNYKITNKVTIGDNFKVALIVSTDDHLNLVGLTNGDIELRHYKRVITKFKGHSSEICSLQLNDEKSRFLSIDVDGIAKLWAVVGLDQIIEKISNMEDIQCCKATFRINDKITCGVICNKYGNVITGSKGGVLKIWKKEPKSIQLNKPIKLVACLNSLIAIVIEGENTVYIYSRDNLSTQMKQQVDGSILNLHVPQNDERETLLVIQKNKIVKFSWVLQCTSRWKYDFLYLTKSCIYNGDKEFISSSLINNYIILTNVDHQIYRIDFTKEHPDLIDEHFSSVECLDACMDDDNNGNQIHALLRKPADRSLQDCYLTISDTPEAQGRQIYSCCLKDSPFIAIVSVANTIKLVKRHSVYAETKPENSNVCAVEIVSDGTNPNYTIYYALENGCIKSYEYKQKNSSLIVDLRERHIYFECLKDLLLLSTKNNFFIYDVKQKRQKLNCPLSNGILRGFFLKCGKLLTVDRRNSTIRLWSPKAGSYEQKELHSITGVEPSSAELSLNETLLCITTKNYFNIFQIGIDTAMFCSSGFVDDAILCCGFSAQNELLAMGTEKGFIYICYLNEKAVIVDRHILKFHTQPVKDLLFAPSDLILATLANQFALWNLELIDRKRPSLSTSNSSWSLKESPMNSSHSSANSLVNVWNQKVGSSQMPHLLASLKIDGVSTNRICASPNFDKFCTVDSGGVIHNMEVFNAWCK